MFNLASCAVLFTACALYLNGALPLSWALTLLVAAFMIYGELIHANDAAFLTKKIEGELDRVDEVCDIPKQNATDAPLAPADFGIEMNGVSFGYDADRRVIDDVSLRIPQGTSCAIVGPSGSGKTTLVNLMARFWDVDAGAVLLGGQDVRKGTAESLLAHVSMVFQNVYLFNDTVENNILMGSSAPHERVVAAAEAASIADVIDALPQGYRTVVGADGTRLSGGEAQRLAIARAMLRDTPLIILDEATAYADAENEAKIQDAFAQLAARKTVLVIAHRMKTVRTADLIVVVDEGRVVGTGTHDDLMDACPLYRSMVDADERKDAWTLTVGKEG